MSVSTIESFSPANGSKIKIGSVEYRVQNADEAWSLAKVDDNTLRFTLRPDDNWEYDSANRERTEIASTKIFAPGEDISLDYQFMIEGGAANTAEWLLLAQFHANDLKTSPPFAVEMRGEKMAIMIRYKNGEGNIVSQYVYTDGQNIERDHFYSMQIEADFSRSGGFLRVWRDGVQIVDYEGPLGYDNGVYWKQGVYRTETNETITVAYRDVAFGGQDTGVAAGETIHGTSGADVIVGTPGDDDIDAAGGADTVIGIEGKDDLDGASGKDIIQGRDGTDKLIGGKGNDKLDGGGGDDILKGGKGNDTFFFVGNFGKDVIKDFKPGRDKISFVDIFANFDEVKDAMHTSGRKVVIESDEGTVILKGVNANKLDADDFLFA